MDRAPTKIPCCPTWPATPKPWRALHPPAAPATASPLTTREPSPHTAATRPAFLRRALAATAEQAVAAAYRTALGRAVPGAAEAPSTLRRMAASRRFLIIRAVWWPGVKAAPVARVVMAAHGDMEVPGEPVVMAEM